MEIADIDFCKAKCGLLLTLMKECFEVKLYEVLESGGFGTMEELDNFLDTELREYFAERDTVKRYYDLKISQMHGD